MTIEEACIQLDTSTRTLRRARARLANEGIAFGSKRRGLLEFTAEEVEAYAEGGDEGVRALKAPK